MKKTLWLNMMVIPILFFVEQSIAAEILRIGGGAAPINNIFKKIKEPFEKATGIQIQLKEDGPDKALKDLDDGALDGAAAGLPFDKWLELMKEKKMDLKAEKELKFRVIGKDLVQVFAHPSVKIKELDKAQLSQIFSGEVKNWKQLGGADIQIRVILGSKIPGTYKFFREKILEQKDYASSGIDGVDTDGVLMKVLEIPGAVGLGPMSKRSNQYSIPNIPEIGRPVSFATKGAPTQAMEKLLDYIKTDGKKFIN